MRSTKEVRNFLGKVFALIRTFMLVTILQLLCLPLAPKRTAKDEKHKTEEERDITSGKNPGCEQHEPHDDAEPVKRPNRSIHLHLLRHDYSSTDAKESFIASMRSIVRSPKILPYLQG
jgi:hypothetical protein